jgi:GT2 family glycosyltransferase
VIVVDNASTDHTRDVLDRWRDDPRVRVRRLARNTGGAGGFAEGMSLAYQAGADLVWIMDDDCYAQPDALERLVAGHSRAEELLGEPVPFAGSLVRWTDGSLCIMNSPPASDDWAELVVRGVGITLVDLCSFVSLLIPAWAIERLGLPLRPYFIWYDDAEYTKRLRRVGRGVQVHDSLVVHDLGENQGVNAKHVDDANLWKFRYGMRNESSYRWHHEGPLDWLNFVLLTTVRLQRGAVPWRLRRVLYGRILAGLAFNPPVEHVKIRTTDAASGPTSTPEAVRQEH